MEIVTEAAQFLFWEYIKPNFFAVHIIVPTVDGEICKYIEPMPLCFMCLFSTHFKHTSAAVGQNERTGTGIQILKQEIQFKGKFCPKISFTSLLSQVTSLKSFVEVKKNF